MFSRTLGTAAKLTLRRPPQSIVRIFGTSARPAAVFTPALIAAPGGGGGPPPPTVTLRMPVMEPDPFQGPNMLTAVINWLTGPPAVIKVEVSKPPEDPPIDTSRCRLMFIKAVAVAAKDFFQSARDRSDEEQAKAEGKPVKSEADSESDSIKDAHKALDDALKDFRDCMKKGMSRTEAVAKLIEDEAKSMIDAKIKKLLKSGGSTSDIKAPLEGFENKVATLEKKYNSDLVAIRKEYNQTVVSLVQDVDDWNKDILQFWANLKKFDAELGTLFTGITKEYTDLIRDTDGLARVNPKVVKAAEACRRFPDTARINALAKAINEDKDTVLKTPAIRNSPEGKAYALAMVKFAAKWVV